MYIGCVVIFHISPNIAVYSDVRVDRCAVLAPSCAILVGVPATLHNLHLPIQPYSSYNTPNFSQLSTKF